MNPKIIVEVGPMRSGTTWLMSLLGSHLNIRTFFEPFHKIQMFKYLNSNLNLIDYLDSVQNVDWVNKPLNAPKKNANIFLIKIITPSRYPHDFFKLEDFLAYDPAFIFLNRNPYSTVNSRVNLFKEVGYQPTPQDYLKLFDEWLYDKHYADAYALKYNSYKISYEKLCINTEEELKKCFSYLNLEFTTDVSSFARKTKLKHDVDNYSVFKHHGDSWEGKLPEWFVSYVKSQEKNNYGYYKMS